ncbi:proline-rich transmembrane protein 4 isoform X2 [Dunckerocampus dactyliophorus]|uniref:proline-rich transmembrane protein 4 isoform X2 n=1 Tax=Dunckerocampus dactyliophorus TaxID=161453 RepID=UPI002405C992|nr:proline-rich transmembrane protein 4 isoform X2 [Dunckerocampus dactyliophorus]
MAFMLFLLLSVLISSLPSCDAQVVIGTSSSFSPLDLLKDSQPSKQTKGSSMTHSGRSAVPDKTQSREPNMSRPSIARPRKDPTNLMLSEALAKEESTTKGLSAPVLTLSSSDLSIKPVTAINPLAETSDLQGLGSGSTKLMLEKEELLPPVPTAGDVMAHHQPQAQTKRSDGHSSSTVEPHVLPMTPRTESKASQATPPVVIITGDPTAKAPPLKHHSAAAVTLNTLSTTTVGSTGKHPQTPRQPVSDRSKNISHSVTEKVATTTVASMLATTDRKTPTKATNKPNQTAHLGKKGTRMTLQPAPAVTSSFLAPSVAPVTQNPQIFATTYRTTQKNRSILLGHPHQAPHSTFNPSPSPSTDLSPNGSLIYWGDLSRTLAFAWELHVYGSASLFLLLFGGAALGLMLSPGSNCPHRGALALANALLFLVGGLRASLFLIDPYGMQKTLPRSAVAAIYNLPLHLLVWAQAALALLSLRVAGVRVLPSTLERPPLVAVLAVLQCTLLLAADLLSPALSPVVPVTLQVLSLCWGLGLCLGFLFYVFPRVRCPSIPHPGVTEEARRKTWTGSRREGVILGKVLAVCAVLGALCCGLHVHATLWLYGLLGDWISFNWGWWLVHFWARLLELAWGLSLLLLASWVFWRPQCCQQSEEGGAGERRTTGEMPSPGHSGSSSHRHTCWSKIVQSLTGKPCRKSDSNGVGGGGPAEVPNNWGGQERSGADITKSLIRNQNHEQTIAQPQCVKDSNRVRNHRGHSAECGIPDGSAGSLLRLQAMAPPPQRSVSGSLDQDRDTSLSMCEFDLRPPSPINLTRSIDEALHREHLLEGGSLFHPLNQTLQSPSPGSGVSPGAWLRRNSDPQFSESSEAPTESSMPLGGSILSSVPSRQVTAPPTPSHQGHRWAGNEVGNVPSSVSCPVSLHPSRTSTGHLGEDGVDDTRPFITPDSDRGRGRVARPVGSRSYLEVSRHDDSASVNSEIIDL